MVGEDVREMLEAEFPEGEVDVLRDDHDHEKSDGAHLGIVVVSSEFEDESKVERHRRVHGVLDSLMGEEVHAVEIRAQTPEEAE